MSENYEGMPRWVKVFFIVAVILGLLVLLVLLFADGQHGPGSHFQ